MTDLRHLFTSYLALVWMHELEQRLTKRQEKLEWSDMLHDVRELRQVEVEHDRQRYQLRPPLPGVCGKVLQAGRVAAPPPGRNAPSAGAKV